MNRIATLLIASALVAPTLQAQEQVRAGQRATLAAGNTVEIFNAVGEVTLRRATGSSVEVTATPQGSEGGQLQFFTDTEGGRARFRVVFPDVDQIAAPEGWGGRTQLHLRADGTFGGDNDDNWGRRRRGDQVDIGGSRGFRGYANLEIGVPDGVEIIVRLAVGRVNVDGVNARAVIDLWSANADATNIAGDWLFDTGSGDVNVRGARGTLKIDTGSGAGIVSGMQGDLLNIDTGSGSVDATDVQVDRFVFDTGSGSVRARRITARRGEADTGSGDVEIEYTGGTVDDLVIDTGSGSARLTLPDNVSARVVVDTGSGGVTVNRSGAIFERRGDDGTVLRFGDGRGRIRIDTGSGNVVIR